ncbi:MAG TPA: glycerol-3-phosphate dehydrogenase/oxidase [Opitutaceae bacterium]|nr:glycerol-3-phosphate dehydrogenase/oxidase [Opitutaceae bacterium]
MSVSVSSDARRSTLAQLREQTLDTLVIGGGIVGSGIARDAALRGLSVGLIDRHDFAYGTSSRSSRLLHGGLRYLEQGRIGLVREASVEKRVISEIAPHLAQPLAFLFPTYHPGGRPLWQLKIGVKLYDLLCSGRNFGPSRGLSSESTLATLPEINPDHLRGAVRYYDALTQDARLVLDTLRSAEKAGGWVGNYLRLLDAKREGETWICTLSDEQASSTLLTVRTRTLVNATGPWAQGLAQSRVKLRLSKGIHLVIARQRLPVTDAVVVTEGKRILFVIPWGERVIIGTTDTDYQGRPEDVRVEPEDLRYVMSVVNAAFPRLHLSPADLISSWAGLRPLIANPDGSPSDISRAHQIRKPEKGWWDVAGGKLTTYRLMAEQTVDQIVTHLGHPKVVCRTAREPLLHRDDTSYSGICPPLCTEDAVNHYVTKEWAVSLSDVLVRRSSWHYYHAPSSGLAERVAQWMGEMQGWTEAERERQLVAYRKETGLE